MGTRGPIADDVRNERLHGLPSPARAANRPGPGADSHREILNGSHRRRLAGCEQLASAYG